MEYVFDRYVFGVLMAEGVRVNADSLEKATKKAATLCPGKQGTVLVYVPTAARSEPAHIPARQETPETPPPGVDPEHHKE